MAIVTAIDDVDASVGIIAKDENRHIGQIHAHNRVADGHGFHLGGHFRDDHRCGGGLRLFLMLRLSRQDVMLGGNFSASARRL